ncbi:hypothetical protein GCM10022252_22130 [Streptosporangium oxazolinicum]|uniref:Uncharacterized protein n=1 Tax=Streptosporangium oxazolinicum TaxID=909287 RepID=A0ABP8AQ42_9ACTN
MRIVEDFPAPLGPRNPNASPRSTWKSIPATAWNPAPRLSLGGYVFLSPFAWISGVALSSPAMDTSGSRYGQSGYR